MTQFARNLADPVDGSCSSRGSWSSTGTRSSHSSSAASSMRARVRVIRTAFQASNALALRWVRSLKTECLNQLILLREQRLRRCSTSPSRATTSRNRIRAPTTGWSQTDSRKGRATRLSMKDLADSSSATAALCPDGPGAARARNELSPGHRSAPRRRRHRNGVGRYGHRSRANSRSSRSADYSDTTPHPQRNTPTDLSSNGRSLALVCWSRRDASRTALGSKSARTTARGTSGSAATTGLTSPTRYAVSIRSVTMSAVARSGSGVSRRNRSSLEGSFRIVMAAPRARPRG